MKTKQGDEKHWWAVMLRDPQWWVPLIVLVLRWIR